MQTQLFRTMSVVLIAVSATALVTSAAAQGNNQRGNTPGMTTHGNPPSVTSFGFGGHPGFHGLPPSVTSPNFNGTPFHFQQPFHQRPIFAPHRHHDRGFGAPFYRNVIAVPYAYPVYVDDPGLDDSMEEQDYRGGPTVFDRRGPGAEETEEYGQTGRRSSSLYEPKRSQDDYRTAAPPEPVPPAEAADQPHTILVFKDGHQREIANYAIVGSTLFDLSDGLTRKVALAELDLPATVKQNDDRGVEFQLPAAKSN